jgi:hypothetical protein
MESPGCSLGNIGDKSEVWSQTRGRGWKRRWRWSAMKEEWSNGKRCTLVFPEPVLSQDHSAWEGLSPAESSG